MEMTVTTDVGSASVTVALLLASLCLLYWYSIYPYSVLSRYGIRHPKPVPFFGNMFLFRQGFYHTTAELVKEYGRVFGYYLGRRPVIVIADPDILRQIMVKEFSRFPNRMAIRTATKPMSHSLLMLRDEQWKRVRSILTPSFSAAKMREMVPFINTASAALLSNLQVHAASGKSFDIHRCFGCFTMDVIASIGFGTQVDSQNNPDNPFVRHAQKFFSLSIFRPLIMFFIMFPFLISPLQQIIPRKASDEVNRFFTTYIREIIRQRDEQPASQRRRDFLQLMLDVRSSRECVSLKHFDVVNHADEKAPMAEGEEPAPMAEGEEPAPMAEGEEPAQDTGRHPVRRIMTEDEIVGQAFLFLVAGYETSSNTLAFVCYLMAMHPECQRKLQEEVDDFFTRHETPDYNNVQELKYLDMVVSEGLRLYPPGFRFVRDVERSCVVNGVALPKGAVVEIPAGFLHRDPQYWPDPEKFIPERFAAEAKTSRHPFAYLPFGAGPRSCVGMRLALLEIRMALIHIFHKFSVVVCEETEVPLELKSFTTLGPKNGVIVKVKLRDD